MDECSTSEEFTGAEREFLATYAMLLRLLFAARSVPVTRKEGEAA